MSDLLNKTIYNPITSERITFLETSKETQGKRSLLEIEVGPKGKGPPLHFHKRFTEEFTMVKGQMKLQLGKRIVTLNEGESCKIEKELLHTFWSESNDPVCFHGKLEPASKDFENGITIMFGLANDGLLNSMGMPKKISHAFVIQDLSDSHVKGIMNLFFIFLAIFINKKKLVKERDYLLERYCKKLT